MSHTTSQPTTALSATPAAAHTHVAASAPDTSASSSFDEARAEAFADRFVDILNGGSLALMTSLGHRAELFDTMAALPPASSADIAAAAGLDERYVREWLGAMTVGRIVEHDPTAGTYTLPPEHAASLTRAATPENLAPFAQYIGLLGTVEDDVLDCFRHGGGVPYERFGRFHEIMAEDSGQTVVAALLEHILPLAPGLTEALEAGIDVLDLGCGRGLALQRLAAAFPRSRFTGYDFSPEAIAHARGAAERAGLSNLRFALRDAAALDERDAYDLVLTFDAIHDQARPDAVLAGIRRALRPGGLYLMQDISAHSHLHGNLDHPLGPLLYTLSTMHCMTVSLAEGGAGLGTMWGRETAGRMLREAGFDTIEIHRLPHDIQNDFYLCR